MCSFRAARRFACYSVMLLVAFGGPPAVAGERFAVIIGIDGYQELGRLKACVADAEGLAKVLAERAGFDPKKIVLLTDNATEPQNKPTLATMRRRIAQVASLAKKDDTLLLFFSGHGTTRNDEGFLIPIDGDLNNAVSLNWVSAELERSAAGTKLLVLDACHAGSAARGVGGIAPSLTSAVMLLSCDKNQVSYPDEARGHGVFTGFLIEGLAGSADANQDKDITVGELFAYVEKQMTDWSLATGKNQTPLLSGLKPGALCVARVTDRAGYLSPSPVLSPPTTPLHEPQAPRKDSGGTQQEMGTRPRVEECPSCNGKGRLRCSVCLGRGKVRSAGEGALSTCPACGGDGIVKCSTCKGTGCVSPSPLAR